MKATQLDQATAARLAAAPLTYPIAVADQGGAPEGNASFACTAHWDEPTSQSRWSPDALAGAAAISAISVNRAPRRSPGLTRSETPYGTGGGVNTERRQVRQRAADRRGVAVRAVLPP